MPILFLHELTHVIMAYILGGGLDYYDITNNGKGHTVVKLSIKGLDKDWKVKIVAMSPILVPFIFTILTILDFNFVYVLVYLAVFYKTTLPSPIDFKTSGWQVPKFLV